MIARQIFVAALLLVASAASALAAEHCDFAYDPEVRANLIAPALATWQQITVDKDDLAARYDFDKARITATGRSDGTLILAFYSLGIDTPTLRVVVDPCAHRVVYVNERQDNIATGIDIHAFKTSTDISDAALRGGLAGSWNAPPDNWIVTADRPNAQPDGVLREVETFRADGSGSDDLYKDASCTVLSKSRPFKWIVRKGALIFTRPSGVKWDDDFLIGPKKTEIGIYAQGRPPMLAEFDGPDHKRGGYLVAAPRCGWPQNITP